LPAIEPAAAAPEDEDKRPKETRFLDEAVVDCLSPLIIAPPLCANPLDASSESLRKEKKIELKKNYTINSIDRNFLIV